MGEIISQGTHRTFKAWNEAIAVIFDIRVKDDESDGEDLFQFSEEFYPANPHAEDLTPSPLRIS